VEVLLDVVQLLLELLLELLELLLQDGLLELKLLLVLVLVLQVGLLALELLQLAWPRWHHRSRQRLWQESSWHHASTIHWYRFSRPSRLCRCASCRWFVHQQRMRAPRRPTTSPLCSVFSWSSS
jgi:hypothetical protein